MTDYKEEIIKYMALEFGIYLDDEIKALDTVSKKMTFKDIYTHIKRTAEYVDALNKTAYLQGEKAGVEFGREQLRALIAKS